MGQARYLLASLASKAKSNIYDGDGKLVATAGQNVILLPKTDYGAVTCKDGQTLKQHWDSLSKTNHTHTSYETSITNLQANLATYNGNMATLAERVRVLEQEGLVAVLDDFDPEESE